jgi:rubrerythrin
MEALMDKCKFSGEEILSIALRLELNGEAFYRVASKMVEEKGLQDLFIYLAMEEKRHYHHFKKMTNVASKSQVLPFYLPDADELSLYLSALSGLEVFTDPQAGAKLGRDVKNDSAALDVAIGLENDAIQFFRKILNDVNEEDKDLVERLIEEEEDHVRRLEDFKKS